MLLATLAVTVLLAYEAVETALARDAAERALGRAARLTAWPVVLDGRLLVALLVLTAALVVVALVQLRRASELARLRAGFVSSISHELRTPLAQIRMFAETLRLGRVRTAEERRRSLQIIDQEARRLAHLVENVLQFARAERGAIHLALEPTDLAWHVRETLEAFAPLAGSRRVTVDPRLGDEVVLVDADRALLRQVLLNLLDNAVKYGPAGQTVTVGLRHDGYRALITVDDRGPGIAPRDRDRIWEPFRRLERDAHSSVAGSGIGLAVVSEIISLHGGRGWAEEAPGGGTRMVVELPKARRRPRAVAAPPNGDGVTQGARD
jgi:signal transduction histidine kinase